MERFSAAIQRYYLHGRGSKQGSIQLQNLNPFIKIERMLPPEQLYAVIPRKVNEWTHCDVQKWFTANNIQTRSSFSFAREAFNGQALLAVTPEYLLSTCGVTSRIIMKKVFEWLDYDKEDFEDYVDEQTANPSHHPQTRHVREEQHLKEVDIEPTERPSSQKNGIEVQCLPTEKDDGDSPGNICGQNQKHWSGIQPLQVQKWKKKKPASQDSIALQKGNSSKENSKKLSNRSENSIPVGASFVKSSYEILESIIQFRFDGKSQFLNNSGKIGRNNTNDIIIVSESVSRRHAEIIKDKNDFFLKDSESKYGTFVPAGVKNRTQIYEGDIIAFEDYEIEVLKYKFYKSNNTFDLKFRRRCEKETIGNFYSKKYVMVGREGRQICINEPTISHTHARITFDTSGQLIIQEQQGKCFRKLKKDELFKLEEADEVLRFGLVVTEIRVMSNHKAIPSISQFNFYQQ